MFKSVSVPLSVMLYYLICLSVWVFITKDIQFLFEFGVTDIILAVGFQQQPSSSIDPPSSHNIDRNIIIKKISISAMSIIAPHI